MRYSVILPIFVFICALSLPATSFAARTLLLGTSGADVISLQNTLITKGYLQAGNNSGFFGALTDAAVRKFQCEQGIACTGNPAHGLVGPRTQAALAGNGAPVTPPSKGPFEFSGWIPYWRAATGTMDTLPHLNQLTTVMPFGYTMKSNGTLNDTAKLSEEPWVSFIAEAKKQKVRVIPSIMWGDGDDIHRILSNTQTRIALEDEIARTVKENGFDGIDIDFEAKHHKTINYFSLFLKGLYQRMGNKWVYCTIEARMPLEDRFSPGAHIPDDATEYANDYAELNKYCDRVEIMAYDQGTIDVRLNKARLAPYAPVSDPGWAEDIVNLAAKSIQKNKLILGIPTYGYEYKVTPLPSGALEYKMLWPFNQRYAWDIASRLNMKPYRNSAGELGLIYDSETLPAPTGDQAVEVPTPTYENIAVVQNASGPVTFSKPFNYLSWGDAQAIKDKVDLAKRLGLRGVAVFKFDGGQDPGMWGVLK